MGGGTSKFETTDWSLVPGQGLTCPNATLDGASPTTVYEIFHIVKKGYNQREFDVFVEDNNNNNKQVLLYTTRAVPGTLACFDLLKVSANNHNTSEASGTPILRVQVDLKRRNWTVYRFNTPCFEGQTPAMCLVEESTDRSLLMYKTACITVSWSRYVAVIARFGAPSIEYLYHLDPDDEDFDDYNEKDKTGKELDAKEAEKEQSSNTGSVSTSLSPGSPPSTRQTLARNFSTDSQDEFFAAAKQISEKRSSTVKSTAAASDAVTNGHNPNDRDGPVSPTSSAPIKAVPGVFVSPSRSTGTSTETTKTGLLNPEERRKAAYQNAMKGVLDLNGPMLQVQEIYNKLVGNHQSFVLYKDQVKRLMEWDQAEHFRKMQEEQQQQQQQQQQHEGKRRDIAVSLPPERSPFVKAIHQEEKSQRYHQMKIEEHQQQHKQQSHEGDASQKEREETDAIKSATKPRQESVPTQNEEKEKEASTSTKTSMEKTPTPPTQKDFEASLTGIVKKQENNGNSHGWWKNTWTSPTGGRKKKSQQALEVEAMFQAGAAMQIPFSEKDQDEILNLMYGTAETEGGHVGSSPSLQPKRQSSGSSSSQQQHNEHLVAYWSWKNSVTVHKMELHLAQHSDVALHVVLCIICNQVRVERNAIAVTI